MHFINKPILKTKYLEQLLWSLALIFLFFMDTGSAENSFCLAKLLGFTNCIGCGIGHSIHYTLQLDFVNAWKEHYMGIPSTLIILWQVFKPFIKNKTLNHGSATINDVKRPSAR